MKKKNILEISSGSIYKVKDILIGNGFIDSKILFVTDKVVDKLYGDVIKEQLKEVGALKETYVEYNTIAFSMSIAERIIATDINLIVAMGGGRVLDVSKYAAYISKTPLLSIPTTATNDGIASPIAVLKRQDDKPKSLGCIAPSMLLIDLDVISNCPKLLIHAGIGDTISNYTALKDWQLAYNQGKDKMNGYAYLMSQNALDSLMKTKFDTLSPEFIKVLVNSLVMSGIAMDFAGSSRPVSGSEHLFSHALDYYGSKRNLHGMQTGLGTIAVLKIIEEPYQEVLNYLKKFQVDINPLTLGITEDDFVFCMQKATTMRKNRYTYLHEANLESNRLKKIYLELTEEL